jgi:hypothetical protein
LIPSARHGQFPFSSFLRRIDLPWKPNFGIVLV